MQGEIEVIVSVAVTHSFLEKAARVGELSFPSELIRSYDSCSTATFTV